MATAHPLGEMKTIVSLVDRTAFDSYMYPSDAKQTVFQPVFKPYHNFTLRYRDWETMIDHRKSMLVKIQKTVQA